MSASELSIGQGSFAVTPHNSNNFARRARTLFVGTAGTVALVNPDGTVTSWPCPANFFIPTESIRVNATGTTASNIIGVV